MERVHGGAAGDQAGVFAPPLPLLRAEGPYPHHHCVSSMSDAYEETPGGAAGTSTASAGAMLRIKVKTMEPATYELSARKNVRRLSRIALSRCASGPRG